MKTYTINEMQNNFSEIVQQINLDTEIGISYNKNEKPVAVIISKEKYDKIIQTIVDISNKN